MYQFDKVKVFVFPVLEVLQYWLGLMTQALEEKWLYLQDLYLEELAVQPISHVASLSNTGGVTNIEGISYLDVSWESNPSLLR